MWTDVNSTSCFIVWHIYIHVQTYQLERKRGSVWELGICIGWFFWSVAFTSVVIVEWKMMFFPFHVLGRKLWKYFFTDFNHYCRAETCQLFLLWLEQNNFTHWISRQVSRFFLNKILSFIFCLSNCNWDAMGAVSRLNLNENFLQNGNAKFMLNILRTKKL